MVGVPGPALPLTLVDSGLASLAPSFPSPYNKKSKGLAQGLRAEDQAAEGRTRGEVGVAYYFMGHRKGNPRCYLLGGSGKQCLLPTPTPSTLSALRAHHP